MSRQAIHQRSGKLVSPEEFVALEGPQYREKGVHPICPVCKCPLDLYGVHSMHVTSRFDHPDGSTCERSSHPDPRYAYLGNAELDLDSGVRLRADMCEKETLKSVYAACRALTRKLTGPEFVEMCRQGDKRNIWAYKGLTTAWLPYVLVTLVDLPACDARNQPLRFVLNKPARTDVSAIWLRPQDCSLEKHFADTGNPVRNGSIPIPNDPAERAKTDTAWISKSLFEIIWQCCADHA